MDFSDRTLVFKCYCSSLTVRNNIPVNSVTVSITIGAEISLRHSALNWERKRTLRFFRKLLTLKATATSNILYQTPPLLYIPTYHVFRNLIYIVLIVIFVSVHPR